MKYTQEITLDIYGVAYQYINTKQYDNNARYIKVSITADGTPVQLDGLEAHVRALKPDGHSVDNPAEISGNAVIVELTEQILACEGVTLADVVLLKDGKVLSSVSFFLEVGKAPVGQNIESKDEFKVMTQATEDARNATEEAKDATQNANDAAGKADGSSEAADKAEAARAKAEEDRVEAENKRVQAEQGRATAEQNRETAENERSQTEDQRKTAEQERADAEAQRDENETARQKAEDDRNTAEQKRVEAEGKRIQAEEGRVTAENERVTAEEERVREHNTVMEEAKDATDAANDAAAAAFGAADMATHPPIIKNGTWWQWNIEAQEYQDTGESARGNVLFATFFVNPADGILYMNTDTEYNGPDFRLTDDGFLEVVI